ncbi:hypothetical protein Hdeb2414_s0028g00701081 [Helianthus debilis subsp. tardiflorus]
MCCTSCFMAFICFTGLYSDVQVDAISLYPTYFYVGFTITLSSSIHPPLSTYRCRQPPSVFCFFVIEADYSGLET